MEIEEIPDEAQKEWDELLVDAVRNEDVAAVETGDAITRASRRPPPLPRQRR